MQFMRLGLEFILDNQNLCWMLWCATKASMDFKHRLLPFSILITCLANWLLVILSSLHEHGIINYLEFLTVSQRNTDDYIYSNNKHKSGDAQNMPLRRTRIRNQAIPSDSPWIGEIRYVCTDDAFDVPIDGIPFTNSISTSQYLLSKHTDWQIDFLSMFKRNGGH